MNRLLMLTSALVLVAPPALAQYEATDDGAADSTQMEVEPGATDAAEIDPFTTINENGFTDVGELIDTLVFANDGEQVGDVERVRYNDAAEIDAIVVETLAIGDLGGREVLIESDAYATAMVGEESRVDLSIETAAFEALPDFDETLASDYPLSDNPLEVEDPVSGEASISGDADLDADAGLDTNDDWVVDEEMEETPEE